MTNTSILQIEGLFPAERFSLYLFPHHSSFFLVVLSFLLLCLRRCRSWSPSWSRSWSQSWGRSNGGRSDWRMRSMSPFMASASTVVNLRCKEFTTFSWYLSVSCSRLNLRAWNRWMIWGGKCIIWIGEALAFTAETTASVNNLRTVADGRVYEEGKQKENRTNHDSIDTSFQSRLYFYVVTGIISIGCNQNSFCMLSIVELVPII